MKYLICTYIDWSEARTMICSN